MTTKSFCAAGKTYLLEKLLRVVRIHPTEHIYRDVYGRRVLLINERYPCFDEFDLLYENRFFHHYYIDTDEGFVHVQTADDRDEIRVFPPVSKEKFVWDNQTWHRGLLEAAGLIEPKQK